MKKSKRRTTFEEIQLVRSFAWLLYDIYDNLLYYRKAPTKKELEQFKDKIHAILSASERNLVYTRQKIDKQTVEELILETRRLFSLCVL